MSIVGQQNKHSREQDKGAKRSPSPSRGQLQRANVMKASPGHHLPPARTSLPHGQAVMAMQGLLLLGMALWPQTWFWCHSDVLQVGFLEGLDFPRLQ